MEIKDERDSGQCEKKTLDFPVARSEIWRRNLKTPTPEKLAVGPSHLDWAFALFETTEGTSMSKEKQPSQSRSNFTALFFALQIALPFSRSRRSLYEGGSAERARTGTEAFSMLVVVEVRFVVKCSLRAE